MSWLYTLVFAGLMFSSNPTPVSKLENSPNGTLLVTRNNKSDETEHFEQTYPLSANGVVSVSNVNGSISIDGWERNEVKLEYTKTADSRERLSRVEIRISAQPDRFSVETDYGNSGNNRGWHGDGKLTVEYRLMVPRGAVLSEIETVNGSASIANLVNIMKVSAVNGSVSANNIRGTAKLSTVNGEVRADFDRLEAGSKISLETVNGKVNLLLPSDANATLKADSVNGNITNDFGLPVRKGKYVGRDMYGRLGNGDVQIRLESVNGGLTVSRKNDGKNLSPATDLLPQKNQDDDGWDNDKDLEGAVIDSAKMNKEIAKAVKESTKATEKAMAKTQKDLEKMQPQLDKITAESIEQAAAAAERGAAVMDSEAFKEKLKDAQLRREEIMAKLADASFFPSVPRVEKKSASITVTGVPKVTIDARGCSVSVRGWDKSEVQYRVTQFSDPRRPEPLNVVENHTNNSVNINVENPDGNQRGGNFFSGSPGVRIEVYVPKKSNLRIDANGEIRIEGVSGDVQLSGEDESINVRDVDGILHVVNGDGRVRVIGFRGQIDAQTGDGVINLEGDFRALNARSGEGDITVTLPDGAGADLDSNSETVESEGVALTKVGAKEDRHRYKLGGGGASFKIDSEGGIRFRSANTLVSKL